MRSSAAKLTVTARLEDNKV